MKPAFGYLRVSGRGQLDGDGKARQKDTISAFAAKNGFSIIRWFFDGAVSGEVETEDRDQYAEMVSLCGDATTKTILVERSDRLGRTLVVCEIACEQMRKLGLTVWGCDTGVDLTNSDDPSRVLIRQMFGSVAEWNKNVMVKRLRVARDRIRVETGRCEGRRAFGQRGNPDDDFTLSLIFTMKLNHYSLRETASELNRRKRPVPEDGQCWHPSSISSILHRAEKIERIPTKTNSPLLAGLSV